MVRHFSRMTFYRGSLVFTVPLLCGCLSVGLKETYGYAQLLMPRERVPNDIGALVLIEGGEFTMGNDVSPDQSTTLPLVSRLSSPAHRQKVPAFQIGKYEVTATEFCIFLNDIAAKKADTITLINLRTGRGRSTIFQKEGEFQPVQGFEYAPAVDVTYIGARAYCVWLSKKTHRRYRLPSEVEWEYAARGANSRTFPWGEESPLGRAFLRVHYVQFRPWNVPAVCTVGQFPLGTTPEGIHDMIGNAEEWCGNLYYSYAHSGVAPKSATWNAFVLPPLADIDVRIQKTHEPFPNMSTVYRGVQYGNKQTAGTAWMRWQGGSPFLIENRSPKGFRVLCEVE